MKLANRPRGGRCSSCSRFCTWRQVRYTWRSSCCYAEHASEREPRPHVLEVLRTGVVCGISFSICLTTGYGSIPNTITSRREP